MSNMDELVAALEAVLPQRVRRVRMETLTLRQQLELIGDTRCAPACLLACSHQMPMLQGAGGGARRRAGLYPVPWPRLGGDRVGALCPSRSVLLLAPGQARFYFVWLCVFLTRATTALQGWRTLL